MTMTGSVGMRGAHLVQQVDARAPGMRMSVSSTSGRIVAQRVERGLGSVEGARHHAAGAQHARAPSGSRHRLHQPDAQG
jgi:hypothetical protein